MNAPTNDAANETANETAKDTTSGTTDGTTNDTTNDTTADTADQPVAPAHPPAVRSIPAIMPAWLRRDYGRADGTTREDLPVPALAKGEVLLRVHVTALNAGDIRLLQGDPMLARLAFGFSAPRQPVRGMDVAATVVAVGPEVRDARVGDEVVCELPGGGGFAAYAIAPAERLVARPSRLDPSVAASLPIAGGTAHQALTAAGLGANDLAGKRVLVLGASGGVGTFAVQLSTVRGAEVWATCGERNRELVGRLGASQTFDYRSTRIDELPADHFDAIIDIAGTDPIRVLLRRLVAGGSLILVSGVGGKVLGPVGRMLTAVMRAIGSGRRVRMLAATAKRDVLADLVGLAAEGRIVSHIEREYAFDEAAEALAHVETGHTVGKVVVLGVAGEAR
ncbi:MAG: NAD(P)-dependent alcohol dehydrogenase [Pseudoclavibacter sp.]